jgi:hypothetical protein
MEGSATSGTTAKRQAIVPQKQVAEWDCGLCCVAILARREAGALREAFEQETGCQSVWTIDLLRYLDPSARYFTRSLDISPALADLAYYQATFERDCQRVLPLLKGNSRAIGRCVPTSEIVSHLRGENAVAIVLICKSKLLRWERSDYLGHYILCVSIEGDEVSYVDPAVGEWRTVSAEHLDASRNVTGTDLDVILCHTAH